MSHACPDAAARVLRAWPAEQAARALARTHPDYSYSMYWFFASASAVPDWCAEVGRTLDWTQVSENLARVRPGDLDGVSEWQTVLGRLGVPLLRSRLRRYVEVMRDCLATAALADIRPPFASDLNLVLALYPNECAQLMAALDAARLAAQLSVAPPCDWRTPGSLAGFIHPSYTRLYEEVVDQLDAERFARTVADYGVHCPYELRCLVWFLRLGPAGKRLDLARRIVGTVEAACRRSDVERPKLLDALSHLDLEVAEKMAERLGVPLVREWDAAAADRPFAERDQNWAEALAEVEALDRSGRDYDVGALFSREDDAQPAPPSA